MINDVYEDILSRLKSSGLIKYFSEDAGYPAPDASSLIKLSKFPMKIFVSDNKLCYNSGDDEANAR